ncbi:PREDICTED: nephrin [Ceratosolen solmsi marchali]|uniref:Nephrin n=1 Tax=Ceratosolen solmsi marchali TaxID=326594 RepID=A0AAJ6YSS6_9HYME|nr:PREDICTED: nephrin [Ceratosolen solmsi marchali]
MARIPPNKPNIINEDGNNVGSKAGPYTEGGDMKLTCLVSGGRPAPTIRWWRGETLLDGKDSPGDFITVKRNTLIVRKLDRSDLHAQFTCQASNNNISQPISASVAIEMHLHPLNVSILASEESPLSAGRKYEINCMTVCSRPPANLTWYIEGQLLTNYTEKISPDGNMTTSILTIVPTLHYNDKSITCRAENRNVKGAVEEDTLKLNILYVPILNLKLGSSMNADDIEEGDDVYFECKIDANPVAYKVVWKHNDNVLQNNAKIGMIVQQTSLALRKVNRSQAGNYSCIASNVEGDGFSNVVELKIMYKPICLSDQKRIYGVTRYEEAHIVCKVEAFPLPDSFRWTFNNTEEMSEVPQARYKDSTRHAESILTYKPVSEMDYGTILCWASNIAGQQKNACIFHIIAAGKPEPPYNCTLMNQTTKSLAVECTAGFDGGQIQHFQLEVYDQQTGQLKANMSSKENAAFSVRDLQSGRVLRMTVYAVNSKGRSESALLEGFTLKVAEKQTGTPVPFEITPLLGILIGVMAALLSCTVTILLALKVRSNRRAQRPSNLPLKKTVAPSSEDLYDTDDRNPDVVPTNKDSDYQLTGSTAGTPLAVQDTRYTTSGTPDGISMTLLSLNQQVNHLTTYSHNDYHNYSTLPRSGEVTYAELCLVQPSTLTTVTGIDSKLSILSGLESLIGFDGIAGGVIIGNKLRCPKEATVYTCIDYNVRPPKIGQLSSSSTMTTTATLASPPPVNIIQDSLQVKQDQQQPPHYPREVVTVRTPLISSQESCV